ncbi:MAG: DUF3047 domain-containing protein [Betaproteobacteria bacterium]
MRQGSVDQECSSHAPGAPGASGGPVRRALLLAPLAGLALQGCAGWGGFLPPRGNPPAQADGWHDVPLPGKRLTRYAQVRKDGRLAVHARAQESASMWRRKVDVSADQLGQARWAWRVDRLNAQASIADVDREDAVARVIFAFEGDRARLSARNRAMFDLAQALTGEAPPYATLMYVWETTKPVDTVVVNPRSDRIRKLVVDSGSDHLGTWRVHQRSLVADFERAFGEKPGALVAIGMMTDADNTQARAEAWYSPIELLAWEA